MLQILREVLNQTATPEFIAIIDDAHDLFDQYQLEDFTLEFESLLACSDNDDMGSLNTAIYNLTRIFQDQILANHLVTLNSECTLVQANHVLRCIRMLETTEYSPEIVNICENESDATDAFVEVLSIVGGLPVVEIATYIDHVEVSLVKRIFQMATQRCEVEELAVVDHELVNSVLEKYKAFTDGLYGENPPLVSTYIAEGVQVGEPFEVYCKYIQEHLTTTKANEIASEYIAAAILAGNVSNLPRQAILEQINKVYTGIDVITPIMISVDKQLLEMQLRSNVGIKKVTE